MSEDGPRFTDDLPGRWDGEPRAPGQPAGRYDPGEKYLLERELDADEAEYQRDLDQLVRREELNQSYHRLEGDVFGLEDGRPGFSFGAGLDGPTLFWDPATAVILRIVVIIVVVILAFVVRARYGSLEEYDARHPQPGRSAPASQTPAQP